VSGNDKYNGVLKTFYDAICLIVMKHHNNNREKINNVILLEDEFA